MDEEMFFMAPSGSDAEDRAGDTDSDDMFLSAHDDLSPLVASLEPLHQLPGEGTAPETPKTPETPAPAQPGADGTAVPQERSLAPAGLCPAEADAPGEGQHPGDPVGVPAEGGALGTVQHPGDGGGGEGAADGGSGRTDSSAEAVPGAEDGGAGGCAGAELVADTWDGEVEEDGADSSPPIPEEPGEGEPHPPPGSPSPEETPQEPAEPPVPGSVPEVVPEVVLEVGPEVVPEIIPEVVPKIVPEVVPEALPPSAATAEGTGVSPGSTPTSPSLSTSAPPEAPPPSRAEPPGAAGHPEPVAVLRRDGSAPVRLAARTVRVQQARSVPVVPPKPQFAKIPPALQPWTPPAAAGDADAAPPRCLPSPAAAEGPPDEAGADRRAGWREGGSASFDAAVAVAAQQQPAQAPVRRIQTYGGGEPAPAAPKALPFQRSPLRPRLLRPLSCMAAPEAEATARSRRSLTRPPVGAEGAAGER